MNKASWLTEEPVTWGEVWRFWMQVGVIVATLGWVYGPRLLATVTPPTAPQIAPSPMAPETEGVIVVVRRESKSE